MQRISRPITGLAAVVLLASAVAGCAQSGTETASDQAAAATVAAASQAGDLETARGSFRGASDHETSGTVSVIRSGGQWVVSLGSDFSFDGAPDPVVALGNGGYDAAAQLGPLQSSSGAQVYALPAGLDIGDYTEVHIWCEEFNVPLGVADLTLL